MRAVKWTGYLLSLLALLAGVVLLILLLTPAGVTLARELGARVLPSLSLTGISGTLLSEVCVIELDYQSETFVVSASELCITPNVWQSLVLTRISLAALSARSLTLTSAASSAAVNGTRTIPELPVVVALDHFTIDELQIDATRIDALSGQLNLARSLLDAQLALRYQGWSVGMTAAGPWSALQLQVDVSVPEPVSVAATLDLTRQELPYTARIRVPSLDLNSLAARNLQLGASSVSLVGDRSRYQFDLTTSGSDEMFGEFELDSSGEGDLQGARLSAQLAVNPKLPVIERVGSLQIDGSVQWLPELTFDVDLVAASLSASFAQHQLTLGGRVHLSGTTGDVLVDASGMTGFVNDLPAAGDLRMRWRADQLDVERADFLLADGRLALAGSLHADQLSGLRVRFDQLPLALARMGAQGLVSGELTVSGNFMDPEFQAELHASQLSYESFASQTVNLVASGTTTDMKVTAAVVTEAYSAEGDFVLRMIDSRTEVDLASLKLRLTPDQSAAVQLTLLEPTRAHWQPGSFSVERSCLTGVLVDSETAEARLCGDVQYPDGTGRIELEEIQLAQLPIPAGDLLVDALVSGRMEIDAFTPLRGRAEFRIAELVANIDSYQRALGTLNGSLQLDNGQAELGLSSEPDQPLQVSGELTAQLATDTGVEIGENTGAKLADSPLQGVLAVSVDGIRIVEEFLPMELAYELSDLRGELHLDVDVSGVLGSPEFAGTLQMRDAGWRNEAIGTDFSNVTMRVQLRANRELALSATGDLGSGSFSVEGQLDGLAGDAPTLVADVTLDDARVIDLPDYSGKLTGKLALEVSSQALKIAGELELPSARVQLVELPEAALSASEDTVIVGARVEPLQQVRTTNVAVTLGDDVRLQALGLDARLEGALRLRESPGLPPDVRGTLTLREGRFKAYGKELQVNRGLLTFSGPMDDPTVDVIASRLVPRESGDVLVSLVLNGTARRMETEVISNPALPEGDALALLLTGRTLSEMTNSEQASMTGTAVTLGFYGASGLTRSIAETLALEEIIVGKDEFGEWEAGAALRLQHNLYLRYTYGAFSRIGGVLLRYRLTDRVSVQAKSGDSHSIELRYGVD